MIGERFGNLTIISEHRADGKPSPRWIVLCDCGEEKDVCSRSVKRGRTKSCGCAQRKSATKHSLSAHPLYPRWRAMLARCYDKNSISFPNYGARGISVCEEWRNGPAAFIAWGQENGLAQGSEIDRIDNDGDYCPENCRVVIKAHNARNTRGNRIVAIAGERMTIAEAAERFSVPYSRVYQRIVRLGWTPSRAVGA